MPPTDLTEVTTLAQDDEARRTTRPGGSPATGAEPALDEELAGLDTLDLAGSPRAELAQRIWAATWPKVAAVAIALFLWQLVVWSGRWPEYVLPGPGKVLPVLWDGIVHGDIVHGTLLTLRRAFQGYAMALVIGVVVGMLVARSKVLRSAVGSLITGLQTMPSIAWFPLAILLFKLDEGAIMFVVVLGAAPAIANGLIAGADNVPPIMLRAGRMLGARGLTLWRTVVLPASLPTFTSGMKQGWAFAWRSLLAGELIVNIGNAPSLGVQLDTNRTFGDSAGLLAVMIVILVVGILADALVFGQLERRVRRRFGLQDAAD